MTFTSVLVTVATWAAAGHPAPVVAPAPPAVVRPLATHTYEARIRLDGRVSTTQVRANDAGHAKKLVQSQFPKATVLSVRKVD